MKSRAIILFGIITLLFQTSCTKDVDKYISVNGTILNEQTKIPINGLNLSLNESSGSSSIGSSGSWRVIKTSTTDQNGKYSFYVKVDESGSWKVDINSEPYNSKYSTNWYVVDIDKEYNPTNYIFQNTTLTVNANTNTPLGANDIIYISLPGTSCKCSSLTTTRAKGGAYNNVSWSVTRNNVTSNYEENIYCPVDSVTSFTINY